MWSLFHDALKVRAMVVSGPSARLVDHALAHDRSDPAATDSSASGSDSSFLLSGAFGFWMSSEWQPAAANSTAAAIPRPIRIQFISSVSLGYERRARSRA